jgi:hypothetical protein
MSTKKRILTNHRGALVAAAALCFAAAVPLRAQTPGTITTVAGCCETTGPPGTVGYSGDGGPATSAHLNNPLGVAFDSAGDFYIADLDNFVVRKVTASTGVITTVAGCCETNGSPGTEGYGGDGGPATSAKLNDPAGVAVDSAGNFYIADALNCIVRVVNTQAGDITVAGETISPGNIQTVAGTPQKCGYGGDGGPATSAELNQPYGVAVDAAGNIDIADSQNCLVRQVNTAGAIGTVAGTVAGAGTQTNCGYVGDNGPATAAWVGTVCGVSVDAAGNIYIGDCLNDAIRVVNRQASAITVAGVTIPTGAIQTVAGCCEPVGMPGYSGDGGPATSARLSKPYSAAVDSAGNIYIGDSNNAVVRKVTAAGVISTVAGCCEPSGIEGYSGDGGPATSAHLLSPSVVAVDVAGDFIFSDKINNVVRKVTESVSTTTVLTTSPNPSFYGESVTFTAEVTSNDSPVSSGTVQFFNGASQLPPASMTGPGQWALKDALLPKGADSISAQYVGSVGFSPSTSNTVTQVVNTPASTTTILITSEDPITYGSAVTFTAIVILSNGSPVTTGSVQFALGSQTKMVGLNHTTGEAMWNYINLGAGSYTVTATYLPSTGYAGSMSAPVTQVVNPIATTCSVYLYRNTADLLDFEVIVKVLWTSPGLDSSTAQYPVGDVLFVDGSTSLAAYYISTNTDTTSGTEIISSQSEFSYPYVNETGFPTPVKPTSASYQPGNGNFLPCSVTSFP